MNEPEMSQESLIELRQNFVRLGELLHGIDFAAQADTGKLAVQKNGEWYKLRESIQKRPELFPDNHQEIVDLIIEVEEGLAHYIQIYGPLPPEAWIQ